MIKVSIIIPNYNHENYLEQRLNSIKNQTYKAWEAIIIDDASTDHSIHLIENYLKKYPDFNVKYFIKNKINSGSGYKSWKKGIELSETDYIWIAETDDYCEPSFLEKLVGSLEENRESVIAFSASNYVDEKGEFLYNSLKRTKEIQSETSDYNLISGEKFIEKLPFNTYITNGSSVVFRKPKDEIPSAIFENKQLSDLFLWTYLLSKGSFLFIDDLLNNFRRHSASTTAINFKTKKAKVYIEYCNYINYFELGYDKSIEVLDHYIKHFLIPNRLSVGYFFTTPVNSLKSISLTKKWSRVLYWYFKKVIKKI